MDVKRKIIYTCWFAAGTTDAIQKSIIEIHCDEKTCSIDQSNSSRPVAFGENLIPSSLFSPTSTQFTLTPHCYIVPIRGSLFEIFKYYKDGDSIKRIAVKTVAVSGINFELKELVFFENPIIIGLNPNETVVDAYDHL